MTSLSPVYSNNSALRALGALESSSLGLEAMEDELLPSGFNVAALDRENTRYKTSELAADLLDGAVPMEDVENRKRKQERLQSTVTSIPHEVSASKKQKTRHHNAGQPNFQDKMKTSDHGTEKSLGLAPMEGVEESISKKAKKSRCDEQMPIAQTKMRSFRRFTFSKKHVFLSNHHINPLQMGKVSENVFKGLAISNIASLHLRNQMQQVESVMEGGSREAKQLFIKYLPYIFSLAFTLEADMAKVFPAAQQAVNQQHLGLQSNGGQATPLVKGFESLTSLLDKISTGYVSLAFQIENFNGKPSEQFDLQDEQNVEQWSQFDPKIKELNRVLTEFYEVFSAQFPMNG